MTKPAKHTRVPDLPYIYSLSGARLLACHEEINGKQHDFVVDYQQLCLTAPVQISSEHGKIVEKVVGIYQSARLRFIGVRSIKQEGLYTALDRLPMDHPARSLRGVLIWIMANDTNLFSLFAHGSEEPAKLWITSRGCVQEPWDGPSEPVEAVRDWSPPPPIRAGLIPEQKTLQRRYGGDPVTIKLGRRTFHQRLFVGSIEHQTGQRPQVDAVLNVGEEPSVWVNNGAPHPSDRCVVRGEGSRGMSVEELTSEANWVIERLHKGQRVLVHCVAGLNRSTSIACAVLILLEGLTAEAALDRVRDHHRWARPDEHHWLILKWLAQTHAHGEIPKHE